jgi:hypothetical protein
MIDIVENVAQVQERIAAACQRSGREPVDVKLVAISKTFLPECIRAAYEAGLRDFGENRVQEAAAKRPALADLSITWHLVGHLQSNKAKAARELFHWVHSLDSFRLAQKLDQAAPSGAGRVAVLLEVNLGAEASKAGVGESEIVQLAQQVSQLAALEVRGLMVIPPFFDDPELVRPYFRRLRELAREIESKNIPNLSMQELSMGMSHDFEVAIEEGATIIRLGTAIFGARS